MQPYLLYRQGNFICRDRFSRETFLVFKNFCLQVEQLGTVGLHLLQMLWPLRQKLIGGTMYSLQAGHSSSIRTLLSMSDTAVCMLSVTRLWWTRLKKGHTYLKHNTLINTIQRLSFLIPTHRCVSLIYVLLFSTQGPWPPQPVPLI